MRDFIQPLVIEMTQVRLRSVEPNEIETLEQHSLIRNIYIQDGHIAGNAGVFLTVVSKEPNINCEKSSVSNSSCYSDCQLTNVLPNASWNEPEAVSTDIDGTERCTYHQST